MVTVVFAVRICVHCGTIFCLGLGSGLNFHGFDVMNPVKHNKYVNLSDI